MLMCKICIARRLIVNIFPWCNANFVPFPSGTLVARRMGNGSIIIAQLIIIASYTDDSTHMYLFSIVLITEVNGWQLAKMKKVHSSHFTAMKFVVKKRLSKKYQLYLKNYDSCEYVKFGAISSKFDIL